MNGWEQQSYWIDQGSDPRVSVNGYVKDGLGIKPHGLRSDIWVVTHLNTGLRAVDIYADNFAEALIYAEELLRSADWREITKSDPTDARQRALGQRVNQIFLVSKRDFEERNRMRERGVLVERTVQ